MSWETTARGPVSHLDSNAELNAGHNYEVIEKEVFTERDREPKQL